jgi:hypothetical protein
MKQTKNFLHILVLLAITMTSAFIAVCGVQHALIAIFEGERAIEIAGPIALTVLFSQLSAHTIMSVLKRVGDSEK